MMQGIGKGAAFVIKFFLVIIPIVRLIPFAFQLQALGDDIRRDRDILVRILFLEIIDMITFGLVFLTP